MENERKLEEAIGLNEVLVVNSGMQVLSTVRKMRGLKMVIAGSAYTLIPRSNGEVISGETWSFDVPAVVCLNKYVPANIGAKTFTENEIVPKRIILRRDNYICQYCGEFGDTVDHIMPKSRGGGNTWKNLCAACKKCNGKKANKTPKEAGLKSPIIPVRSFYSPRKQELQQAFYRELEALV